MNNFNIFSGTVAGKISIISVVLFIATIILQKMNPALYTFLVYNVIMVPSLVIHEYKVWQFFTYMFFLPPSILHAAIDIMILLNFGLVLENIMGAKKFLIYFLLCGVGSSLGVFLVSLLTGQGLTYPLLGPSGAIMGLLFAFAVFFPEQQILLMFVIPVKAKYTILIYAIVFVVIQQFQQSLPISTYGQFGSIIMGFLYFKLIYPMHRNKRTSINKYTKKINKLRDKEGHGFIEKHDDSDKDMQLKKKIIEHLHKNPSIDSLTDDEYQYINYINILVDDENLITNSPPKNLESLSNENFIAEIRRLTKK